MVRLGTPSAVARPEWYDRNPVKIRRNSVGAGISPHSDTERWTYTVPAGKKAIVESLQTTMIRKTAATTAGRPYAHIIVAGIAFLKAVIIGNAIGDRSDPTVGPAMVLVAGETITANTADDSTGGTVDFFVAMTATEFDA